MSEQSDCPGRFKCHGPSGWCPQCGNVDLVCDDPRCEVHLRLNEKRKIFEEARLEFVKVSTEYQRAKKAVDEAERTYRRHQDGNAVMVGREMEGGK